MFHGAVNYLKAETLIVTCHVSRVADLVAGAGDGRRGRGGGVAVGGEHVAGGGAVDNLCNRIQYSTVQHSTVQYSTVQYSTARGGGWSRR